MITQRCFFFLAPIPPTNNGYLQLLTIHFWQWPLWRNPSGQNICSRVTLNSPPPWESCFCYYFMALQANENKWAQPQSSSFIVMTHHCDCLLGYTGEINSQAEVGCFASLLLLCISIGHVYCWLAASWGLGTSVRGVRTVFKDRHPKMWAVHG